MLYSVKRILLRDTFIVILIWVAPSTTIVQDSVRSVGLKDVLNVMMLIIVMLAMRTKTIFLRKIYVKNVPLIPARSAKIWINVINVNKAIPYRTIHAWLYVSLVVLHALNLIYVIDVIRIISLTLRMCVLYVRWKTVKNVHQFRVVQDVGRVTSSTLSLNNVFRLMHW